VILALEMGGNNPMVVLETAEFAAAARIIVASPFISAGQRCTCSRRLILVEDDALSELIRIAEEIRVGPPDEVPEPFIGQLINRTAAQKVLQAQEELIERGGEILVKCRPTKKGIPFLRPGLLDVTSILNPPDEEIFGPLLLVTRVTDFETAILEANSTRFGLAAGLIGGREQDFGAEFGRELLIGTAQLLVRVALLLLAGSAFPGIIVQAPSMQPIIAPIQ
jgi:succinylglutamic semialdehyde dehydrogenase